MENPDRCPNCGRFIEYDADGFYAQEDPHNDVSHVLQFCDERCCDRFYHKREQEQRVSQLPSTWPDDNRRPTIHDDPENVASNPRFNDSTPDSGDASLRGRGSDQPTGRYPGKKES
jgi:hypothetical protein